MNLLEAIEMLGERSGTDRQPELDMLGPELKKAFEQQDMAEVERILGSRSNLMMLLIPTDDDEPGDTQPDDDGDEDTPEKGRLAG